MWCRRSMCQSACISDMGGPPQVVHQIESGLRLVFSILPPPPPGPNPGAGSIAPGLSMLPRLKGRHRDIALCGPSRAEFLNLLCRARLVDELEHSSLLVDRDLVDLNGPGEVRQGCGETLNHRVTHRR